MTANSKTENARDSGGEPTMKAASGSVAPIGARGRAIIQLQHVSKTYQMGETAVHALSDVSLSISAGEFVAIMGPSGSGKSTLMNLIGCLDAPSGGSYRLAGREVAGLSPSERAVVRNQTLGFVFQGFNLLSRTSALDNVELPLLYAGVNHRQRRARAEAALASVGLAARMDHLPSQLSGGQQQRVAVARALVNRPPVILADEPTGSLDTRTSLEIMGLFQRLSASGMTIVLVTHEPDIAAFASRVLIIRDGKVVSDQRQHPVAPIPQAPAGTRTQPQPTTQTQPPQVTS
jgi:putative ABC transport system ATP-binding protein